MRQWDKQLSAIGSVTQEITVTPSPAGNKILKEMIVEAPLATDLSSLIIYKDSVAAGSILFTGYMADRNADGAIEFPGGKVTNTAWIVIVGNGSGSVFIDAKYN